MQQTQAVEPDMTYSYRKLEQLLTKRRSMAVTQQKGMRLQKGKWTLIRIDVAGHSRMHLEHGRSLSSSLGQHVGMAFASYCATLLTRAMAL